jgi:predicted kinase
VRVDTIEEALLTDGGESIVALGAGYRVAYAIAEDNLEVGRTVIADSVNPIKITREAWQGVAKRSGAPIVDVVVVCTNETRHRHRIEARSGGAHASTWLDVSQREFDAVDPNAIVIDTAVQSVQQSLYALQAAIRTRTKS